jgi:hypothetical protein
MSMVPYTLELAQKEKTPLEAGFFLFALLQQSELPNNRKLFHLTLRSINNT